MGATPKWRRKKTGSLSNNNTEMPQGSEKQIEKYAKPSNC